MLGLKRVQFIQRTAGSSVWLGWHMWKTRSGRTLEAQIGLDLEDSREPLKSFKKLDQPILNDKETEAQTEGAWPGETPTWKRTA